MYTFLDGVREGGREQKEWLQLSQMILEEAVCSWKGKLLFIYVALNTGFPLTALTWAFGICNEGVEVLPEIA